MTQKFAIVMTLWEEDEDTTVDFFDTYEEAVNYLVNVLGLTRAVDENGTEYWYNSAEKYTIEEME